MKQDVTNTIPPSGEVEVKQLHDADCILISDAICR